MSVRECLVTSFGFIHLIAYSDFLCLSVVTGIELKFKNGEASGCAGGRSTYVYLLTSLGDEFVLTTRQTPMNGWMDGWIAARCF